MAKKGSMKKAVTKASGKGLKGADLSKNRKKQAQAKKQLSPKPKNFPAKTTRGDKKGSRNEKKPESDKKRLSVTKPDTSEDEESLSVPTEEKNMNANRQKVDETSESEESARTSDGANEVDEEEEEEEDDGNGKDKNELHHGKKAGFTDENAKWLKPKQKELFKRQQPRQLLSSDDEDDDDVPDGDEFDAEKEIERSEDNDEEIQEDEDDDEEEEEELEVERQARRLDEELKAQEAEAEQELRRTIAENTEIFHLPTKEELEKDNADRVVPPSEIKSRVESILEVLADFKNRREEGRSRSEYVEQLISDIAELHGYLPELVEYFHSMFGPSETLEFVDASDKQRPLVIRTNTLKARRKDLAAALMKRGVTLDPLAAWSKVGLKIIESPVPIGATPEYLSGMYMLQSAASMCPVMALSPQLKEKVLDMSAAPGGKTSYIAQLMRNTGVIYANDLKAERQKATVANLHRLGVKNVIACALDGRKLGKMFHNRFDRILLDAPCSGLGVISRDPSVKVQRTIADVQRCAHLQKELLLAAIDALNYKSKTGGVMVYSTCSVSVAENEEVVNYALSKRDIKIIETGLDFGKPGFTRYQQKRFHPSVAMTRRFYPHVHNMDGFYVAKIQKLSDRRPEEVSGEQSTNVDDEESNAENDVENEAKEEGVENENESSSEDEQPEPVVRSSKFKEKRKIVAGNEANAVGGRHSKKPRRDDGNEQGKKMEQQQKDAGPNKKTKKSPSSENPASAPKASPTPTKKKRLYAKVTKPRRPKASAMT